MRKFGKALEDVTRKWFEADKDIELLGLGANYENGLDGSMGSLAQDHPGRIHDVPASESSFTGLALGRALNGLKTIVHHGRAEFAMFAADQIFTQAAKWRYQYGGEPDVPLVVRVALGRQWGNGPQHTASYLQFFSAVPGLRTVIASSPNSAEKLLDLSISTLDPIVFLEPRWLYGLSQERPAEIVVPGFGESYDEILAGGELAVISYGEGVLDCRLAIAQAGSADVALFDFWNLTPGSGEDLIERVIGFKSVLFVDPYCSTGGPLFDLLGRLAMDARWNGELASLRVPNVPIPTATSLTESYYLNQNTICKEISRLSGHSFSLKKLSFEQLHLPPKVQLGPNWELIEC